MCLSDYTICWQSLLHLLQLSAMLPVAIVFAAILADVTASSAISPVAIVPSSIWSVVI